MYKKHTYSGLVIMQISSVFLFAIMFLLPNSVFAETLTAYTRTPSGSPIYGNPASVSFTWTVDPTGDTALSMLVVAIDGGSNILGTCMVFGTGSGADTLSLPINSYSDVKVVTYQNVGCSNNNTPVSSGDSFVVSNPPVAATSSLQYIDSPAQDYFYAILLFVTGMIFPIWFFRRKS